MISLKINASDLNKAARKFRKLADSIETAEKKTNEEIPKKAAPEIESASRFAVEDICHSILNTMKELNLY